MSLSKKHYRELVKVIREARTPQDPNLLDMGMVLTRLCNFLKADNPKFDEEKFYAAVYEKGNLKW
jgi:hypothetical protein